MSSDVKKYGTCGRIEIPDLRIGVPLYRSESGDAQRIVDQKDSAVYLNWHGQIAIADHNYQNNFSNLNLVVPGKTKAFIVTGGGKKGYVCYKSQVGHIKTNNGKNEIYDENWEPVFQKNQGGLTIYTCMKRRSIKVTNIRLTYWKPI